MEHIIHSHIMNHFDNDNILSATQNGFRKHRSCETQLIEIIAKSINNCEQMIASILLDFCNILFYIDTNVQTSQNIHKVEKATD